MTTHQKTEPSPSPSVTQAAKAGSAEPPDQGRASGGALGALVAVAGRVRRRATVLVERHGLQAAACGATLAIGLLVGCGLSLALADRLAGGSHPPTPAGAASVAAMLQWKGPMVLGMGQRDPEVARLGDQVRTLKASLDGLRRSVDGAKSSDDLRQLKTAVSALQEDLQRVKNDTGSTLAQLSGQLDRIEHADTGARLGQIIERLDRIERQTAAPATTGAIPPARPSAANPEASPEKPQRKTGAVAGWLVRDVYDGVALLESRRGLVEVGPGQALPGVGRVESIERREGRWVVVTSAGIIESARW